MTIKWQTNDKKWQRNLMHLIPKLVIKKNKKWSSTTARSKSDKPKWQKKCNKNAKLGMTNQSYIEKCQMAGRSPQDRFMIWLLAQQFRLDLQRGANLTEQSLLELDVENFSYSGFETICGEDWVRAEFHPVWSPTHRAHKVYLAFWKGEKV